MYPRNSTDFYHIIQKSTYNSNSDVRSQIKIEDNISNLRKEAFVYTKVKVLTLDRNYNRYRTGNPYGQRSDRPTASFGDCGYQHPNTENCLCTNQPISLAMAYVKDQPFCALYSPQDALKHGTLFTELYMPYCMGGGRRC